MSFSDDIVTRAMAQAYTSDYDFKLAAGANWEQLKALQDLFAQTEVTDSSTLTAAEEQQLCINLQRAGRREHNVEGKGNCVYLSLMLLSAEATQQDAELSMQCHKECRQLVCDIMEVNPTFWLRSAAFNTDMPIPQFKDLINEHRADRHYDSLVGDLAPVVWGALCRATLVIYRKGSVFRIECSTLFDQTSLSSPSNTTPDAPWEFHLVYRFNHWNPAVLADGHSPVQMPLSTHITPSRSTSSSSSLQAASTTSTYSPSITTPSLGSEKKQAPYQFTPISEQLRRGSVNWRAFFRSAREANEHLQRFPAGWYLAQSSADLQVPSVPSSTLPSATTNTTRSTDIGGNTAVPFSSRAKTVANADNSTNTTERISEPSTHDIAVPEWLTAQTTYTLEAMKQLVETYAATEQFTPQYKGPSEKNTSLGYARFVCSRKGKPESETKGKDDNRDHRNRSSDKCSCTWAINIKRDADEGKWRFAKFKLEHKGGCVPGKIQYQMQQKKKEGQVIPQPIVEKLLVVLDALPSITKAQLRESLIRYKYRGRLDSKSLWNLRLKLHRMLESNKQTELTLEEVESTQELENPMYVRLATRVKTSALQAAMHHNSATELMEFLKSLKELNPTLEWGYSQDGSGKLTGVWLQTPAQKQRYQHFGDHLYLDATEGTNTDNFPTFACVGLSADNKCRTFCLALTLNQSNAAAKWTLTKLKASAPGITPHTIFCDSALLDESVQDVFPSTKPISCQWHIKENIKNNFLQRKELQQMQTFFEEKLFKAESKQAFEIHATSFRKNFPFANSWFDFHYERRHRWGGPWLTEVFTLGHTSSSMAEASHSAHKAWIPGDGNNLLSYIKYALQYDNDKVAEDNQYLMRTEIHADKLGLDSFLLALFLQGYSPHSINKFDVEWKQVSAYQVHKTETGDYQVTRSGYDKTHTLKLSETPSSVTLTCDCVVNKYGSVNERQCGIPCRHTLCVLNALAAERKTKNTDFILKHHNMTKRWKRLPLQQECVLSVQPPEYAEDSKSPPRSALSTAPAALRLTGRTAHRSISQTEKYKELQQLTTSISTRGSGLRGFAYDKLRNILKYIDTKITGANAEEAFGQTFVNQIFLDFGEPSASQLATLISSPSNTSSLSEMSSSHAGTSKSESEPAGTEAYSSGAREERKVNEIPIGQTSSPLHMPTPLQSTLAHKQRPLGLAERVGKGGSKKAGQKRKSGSQAGARTCTLCGNPGHTASSSQCDLKKRFGKKMTRKQFAHAWVLDLPRLASKPSAPFCDEPPRGIKTVVLVGTISPHETTSELHKQQILCTFFGENATPLGEGLIECGQVQRWCNDGKSSSKRVFIAQEKPGKAEKSDREEDSEEAEGAEDEEGEETPSTAKKARAVEPSSSHQHSSALAAQQALFAHVRRTQMVVGLNK